MNSQIRKLITENLSLASSTWSIGIRGALAEFVRDEEESVTDNMLHDLQITTARGAIKILPTETVQLVCHDKAIHFCLPDHLAQLRTTCRVLTELGDDNESLSGKFQQDILFDLGLAIDHVKVCVRTGDFQLLAALRSYVGCPVLGHSPELLRILAAASPHRVFCSALARIEVYGPIPTERTPDGPHTHLLPALFNTEDESLCQLIPRAHRICLSLYQSH